MKANLNILIYSAAVRMDDNVDLNIGDEALSDCLATGISTVQEDACVRRLVSICGQNVSLGTQERALTLTSVLSEIRWANVIVIGGGTLLQDDPGLLRWQVLICTLARAFRKPVVIAAVGAEGLERWTYRLAARYICRRASAITVRDQASSDVVIRVSDRAARVAADPVLLRDVPSQFGLLDLLPGDAFATRQTIAVNLTREAPPQFVSVLAGTLTAAIGDGAIVVGIAMDRRPDRDTAALDQLGQALDWPESYRLVPSSAGWRDVCANLAAADLCIGMRLHFMLLATISSSPVVSITTLPKTIAFANEFGISRVTTDATDADLLKAMSHAQASSAETLASMATRAARTVEDIIATA